MFAPLVAASLSGAVKRATLSARVREVLTGFLIVVLGIAVAFAAYALVDMLLSPVP